MFLTNRDLEKLIKDKDLGKVCNSVKKEAKNSNTMTSYFLSGLSTGASFRFLSSCIGWMTSYFQPIQDDKKRKEAPVDKPDRK